MKIDPVIIHDAANKWVKGKPEPEDKMREEYDPLMGLRSRDNLSRRRKTVADFLGQIPGRPQLFNILLLDGGGHPLASCSGSGHFRRTFVCGEMNVGALGLGRRERDEQKEKKAWVERERPFPFIEAMKLCASPLA